MPDRHRSAYQSIAKHNLTQIALYHQKELDTTSLEHVYSLSFGRGVFLKALGIQVAILLLTLTIMSQMRDLLF